MDTASLQPQPLTPEDEARFRAVARHAGDPIGLAESLGLPYSELLAWVSRPRIQFLLDQHQKLLAHCEANRARQASAHIAARLTDDFNQTDDPKERRRVATPLMRAGRPTPLPSSRARAATERQRAGGAPPASGGAGGTPASAPTPDRAGVGCPLPSEVVRAWDSASSAVTAFTHSPPRIPARDFLDALTVYARAWESHHAPLPPPDPASGATGPARGTISPCSPPEPPPRPP